MRDVLELLEEAREAHRRLLGITIRGEGCSGDPRKGFIIRGVPSIAESGEGGISGFTGACCLGEDCSILSAADCATAGGVYLGDFTVCFPNPCVTPPPTGACCVDGDCSILTFDECVAAGGDWFSDTPCDPNPCALPPCNGCGFTNELLPGRTFHHVELTISNYQDPVTSDCTSEPNDTVCNSFANCYTTTPATQDYDSDCNYSFENGNARTDFWRAACLDHVCPDPSIVLSEDLGYNFSGDPCAACGQAPGQTLDCVASGDTVECTGTFGVNHFVATYDYSNECTP